MGVSRWVSPDLFLRDVLFSEEGAGRGQRGPWQHLFGRNIYTCWLCQTAELAAEDCAISSSERGWLLLSPTG